MTNNHLKYLAVCDM